MEELWVAAYRKNSKRITLKQPEQLPPGRQPLDATYTYPYRISLQRIDHLPVHEMQTCRQLELRFTFFDKSQAMFFGNTLVMVVEDSFLQSSSASMSLLSATKYSCNLSQKQVYFHTNSTNPDVLVVMEIAALRNNMVNGEEFHTSVGWTFFHPFNPNKGGLDLHSIWKNMDNKASQNFEIPIYQGTPRILPILFSTLKEIPNMHLLSNSSITFKFATCSEISTMCSSAFPPFVFAPEEYLPFEYNNNAFFTVPQSSSILSNIILTCPNIIAVEQQFLKHVADTVSSISVSNKIVERRIHVGYHNSCFFASPPKVVHLQPILHADGEVRGFRFDGEVEVKNVKERCALVFLVEYRVKMQVRRSIEKRAIFNSEEEEVVEFVKDISLGWGHWSSGRRSVVLCNGANISPYGKFNYVPLEPGAEFCVSFDLSSPDSPRKKRSATNTPITASTSPSKAKLNGESNKLTVIQDVPNGASVMELNAIASPKKAENIRRSNMEMNMFDQQSPARIKKSITDLSLTTRRSQQDLLTAPLQTKRSANDLSRSSKQPSINDLKTPKPPSTTDLSASSASTSSEMSSVRRGSFERRRAAAEQQSKLTPVKEELKISQTLREPNVDNMGSVASLISPSASASVPVVHNVAITAPLHEQKEEVWILQGLDLPARLPKSPQPIDISREIKDINRNEMLFQFLGMQMYDSDTTSLDLQLHVYNASHSLTVKTEANPGLFTTRNDVVSIQLKREPIQESLQCLVAMYDFMQTKTFFIEIFHPESKLYYGSVHVPAVHFLRQGRDLVEYFVEGEIRNGLEVVGKLYLIIRNALLPMQKKREKRSINGAVKQITDEVYTPLKMVDTNPELSMKLLQQKNKMSIEELDRLSRVLRFYRSNEFNIVVDENTEPNDLSKELQTIVTTRERTMQSLVAEKIKEDFCVTYDLDVSPGHVYYLEYSFTNPFMKDMSFTAEYDDTDLVRIENPEVLQSLIRQTPKNLIKFPIKKGSNQYSFRAHERAVIPFMFQVLDERKCGEQTKTKVSVFSSSRVLSGIFAVNATILPIAITETYHFWCPLNQELPSSIPTSGLKYVSTTSCVSYQCHADRIQISFKSSGTTPEASVFYIFNDINMLKLDKIVKVYINPCQLVPLSARVGELKTIDIQLRGEGASRSISSFVNNNTFVKIRNPSVVLPSTTFVNVTCDIKCDQVGEKQFLIYFIDRNTKSVFVPYLILCNFQAINVSKVFDVSIQKGKLVKKRISYTNPSDTVKSVELRTNRPDLLIFKNPKASMAPNAKEYIGLQFQPCLSDKENVYIYLVDHDSIEECLLLRVEYV